MIDFIQSAALAAQMVCVILSLVQGIGEPARGAFVLASFWCLGVNIGAGLAKRCNGGDS